MPEPAPYGQLSIWRDQPGDRIRIEKADPWILIGDELWDHLAMPTGQRWAQMDGDRLTVTDDAGTVAVYRRHGRGPQPATWVCERISLDGPLAEREAADR
jgi:hypothetical protein